MYAQATMALSAFTFDEYWQAPAYVDSRDEWLLKLAGVLSDAGRILILSLCDAWGRLLWLPDIQGDPHIAPAQIL